MHHAFLDRYSDGESPVHALDPAVKALLTFLFAGVVATIPAGRTAALGFCATVVAVLWIIARLPVLYLVKRLAVALPFVAIMYAGMAAFAEDGSLAAFAAAKAFVSIGAISLLASTTPFPSLLSALDRLKVPRIMTSLLSFIYRFVYILVDEFERLKIGRKSREFSRTRRLAWRGRAWMLGTFLIRSMERSDRVYGAMLARGYDGRPPVIQRAKKSGVRA